MTSRRRPRRAGRRPDRLRDDHRPRDDLLRRPAVGPPAHRRAAGHRRLPRRGHRRPARRAVPGAGAARARRPAAPGRTARPYPAAAAPRRDVAGRPLRPGGRPARPAPLGPAGAGRGRRRAPGRRPAPAAGGSRRLGAGLRPVRAGAAAAAARPPGSAGRTSPARPLLRRGRPAGRRHPGPAHRRRPGRARRHRPALAHVRRRRRRGLPGRPTSQPAYAGIARTSWSALGAGRAAPPRATPATTSSAPAASPSAWPARRAPGSSRSTWCPGSCRPTTGRELRAGLVQRVRALDAFLHDVYGDRAVVERRRGAGLGHRRLARSCGPAGALVGRPGVRAQVAGIDLVRDADGDWCVLEDNLRVPSGIGYAMQNRRLTEAVLPELPRAGRPARRRARPRRCCSGRCSTRPRPAAGDDPAVVVLSQGPDDSAWFEHRMLAEEMGVPLVREHRPAGRRRPGVPAARRHAAPRST